jgi:predicted PurR-regulated permease PerM
MDESPKKVVFSISTASIFRIIIIIAAVALFWYLLDVFLILLTAIVIASAVEPGVLWLIRRKIPRVVATIIIYTLMALAMTAFFYFILPTFLHDLVEFVRILPEKIKTLTVDNELFAPRGTGTETTDTVSLSSLIQNITNSFSASSEGVLSTLSAISGGVTSFLLIFVLSFYFTVREGGIEDFLKLITPFRHESYVIGLWHRSQAKIGRWIQGQLILALIVGVLVFIGLTILGVRSALLLAFISTVLEIIPIFGPIIAAVPAILIAFTQGGFTFAIVVTVMYVVIQQIESNVIYPLVVRKVLDVPPLIVIIALLVGGKLGGFLGLLLSVPIAAAVLEYMNDVIKNRNVARAKFSEEHTF